jgi:hypothetical protein
MRVFLLFILIFSSTSAFCQDSIKEVPSKDQYFLTLNIPESWSIKRMIEGKDITMIAESPDQKNYLYYVQFMQDEEVRPKNYLDTYTSQFAMNNADYKIVKRKVNGKKVKFYMAKDKGSFLDEEFNMIIFATAINNRNVITYLLYPLNIDKKVANEIEKIMMWK